MKTGFNLLLWSGFITDEHHHILKALKDTGYDGVELPLFDGDTDHYQKLGKVLDDLGLQRTAVTVIPDEEHSVISDEKSHREAGLKRLKWAVDCCEAVGAETLIGPYHQPLAVFSGEGASEAELSHGAECHRELAEYAQNAKVKLAIEYLNRFECYFLNTMADAAAYVERVNHPNFRAMFDTFHANIEEKDPAAALREHIDVVEHVHISENDRGTPGRGHTDWKAIFAALKETGYDNWLTIEAFGRSLPELAAATRVWRDFFPSPDQVYTEGLELIKKHWKG